MHVPYKCEGCSFFASFCMISHHICRYCFTHCLTFAESQRKSWFIQNYLKCLEWDYGIQELDTNTIPIPVLDGCPLWSCGATTKSFSLPWLQWRTHHWWRSVVAIHEAYHIMYVCDAAACHVPIVCMHTCICVCSYHMCVMYIASWCVCVFLVCC